MASETSLNYTKNTETPLRVAVIGSRGRMGLLACEWVRGASDLLLVAEIDKDQPLSESLQKSAADVALDLTTAASVRANAFAITESKAIPVIGTSGLSQNDLVDLQSALAKKNKGGMVIPNFSIGAVLAMRFSQEAARWFSAAEIIEAHHTTKADAPSGTARATAALVSKARGGDAPADSSRELVRSVRGGDVDGVRVHSLRLPGIVAHQESWFGGEGEILKITHDTTDRSCFRAGVLLAIRSAPSISGLVVGLESVLYRKPA